MVLTLSLVFSSCIFDKSTDTTVHPIINKPLPEPSQDLEFVLNEDEESYSVKGIGGHTDSDLLISETYNDLPVTSIENEAFKDCVFLERVTIPDSVTKMGGGVFFGCSNLIKVTLGNGITEIPNDVYYNGYFIVETPFGDKYLPIERINSFFGDCVSLQVVEMPNSVVSIGERAFVGCTALKEITIPASVTEIRNYAFYNCQSIERIEVAEDNQNYKSIDGNLYSKDGTIMIQYAIGKKDREFVVPDGVVSIEKLAFYNCKAITNVTISDTVTDVGLHSFEGCTSLVKVTIGNSVTTINGSVFRDCVSLIEICNKSTVDISNYFPQTKHIISDESQSAIKYVGDYVFFDDGNEIYVVKYLGDDTEITLPKYEGGKEYGIWQYMFAYNNSFTKITIPSYVTIIDECAIYNCFALENIEVDKDNQYYKSIDGNLYSKDGTILIQYALGKKDTSFVVPNSVIIINDRAFYMYDYMDIYDGESTLTSITIPASVKRIGMYAFGGCKSLDNITFKGTVEQWKNVVKDSYYFSGVSVTKVVCSDGETN